MPSQESGLIAVSPSGCMGCPCALAGSFVGTLSQQPNRGRDALAPGDDAGFGRGPFERGRPALGRREAPLADATNYGHPVQAALLVFGAPLLLLLLSAAGAAAFAAHQPIWALAGLTLLPGIVAGARLGIGKALQSTAQ